MSMELICDKEHWTCTYMNWSKIRNECVKATFAYIEHYIQTNTIRVNNEERRLQDNIIAYINKIRAYKSSNEHLTNADLHLYSGFLEECKHIEFIDLLVKFGVSGLYALCHKSDCEGFYSVGNAYDICDIIPNILNFTSDNYYNRCFNSIHKVFKESLELKRIVSIY